MLDVEEDGVRLWWFQSPATEGNAEGQPGVSRISAVPPGRQRHVLRSCGTETRCPVSAGLRLFLFPEGV